MAGQTNVQLAEEAHAQAEEARAALLMTSPDDACWLDCWQAVREAEKDEIYYANRAIAERRTSVGRKDDGQWD